MVRFPRPAESVPVEVGGVVVGGGHPIVVQSMTNTDTADADITAIQDCAAVAHAGSKLSRITVNNEAAATTVPVIVQKVRGLGAAPCRSWATLLQQPGFSSSFQAEA